MAERVTCPGCQHTLRIPPGSRDRWLTCPRCLSPVANPEAAVKILYEVFPQTKPTGKDEATAIRDDVKVLSARIVNWKLDKAGVKRWGENSEANYAAYADFLLKYGIIKDKISARDLITNDLIDAINRFDASKVAAEAKAYK